MDADRDAKGVAMADAEVESREAAHGDAGEHVGLTFAANGIAGRDEVPDILEDHVLEIAGVAVDEEAARLGAAGLAREAAVRSRDDDRRQFAQTNVLVDART